MKHETKTKTKPQHAPPRAPLPSDRRRKHRTRPTPRWLKAQQDLDEVARRRVLLVLSVLSGEKPVTDAIVESGISRGLYYQLEERALRAMLRALTPGQEAAASGQETSGADGYLRRISELEERVKRLETDKRRAERLLLLTRKVLPRGAVTTGRGRPKGSKAKATRSTTTASPSSTSTGRTPSTVSPRTTPRPVSTSRQEALTPTPTGASAP